VTAAPKGADRGGSAAVVVLSAPATEQLAARVVAAMAVVAHATVATATAQTVTAAAVQWRCSSECWRSREHQCRIPKVSPPSQGGSRLHVYRTTHKHHQRSRSHSSNRGLDW
jgi:hypothetical protein